MENQNNNLSVDKELVMKMARYILNRPVGEAGVLQLVNEMISKGLLVNQVAQQTVPAAVPPAPEAEAAAPQELSQ